MKRLIYFLLLLAGMGAAVCLLLFKCDYLQDLKAVFNLVKAGTWSWSDFSAYTVWIYGLVAYLFIVAILVLSLLIMSLTTLFKFSRIHRFYATGWWYLIAALMFTGAVVFSLIQGNGAFMDNLKDMPWEWYVPLGSALVLFIVGIVLKKTERNDY